MKINNKKEKINNFSRFQILKKGGILLSFLSFFTFSSFDLVFAAEKNDKNTSINAAQTLLDSSKVDKGSIKEIQDDKAQKEKYNLKNNAKPIGEDSQSYRSNEDNKKYSIADLNKLSYSELAKLLKEIDYMQIEQALFVFDKDAIEFFGDKERILYVLEELKNSASSFDGENDYGYKSLGEVIRAFEYMVFYHNEIAKIKDDNSFKQKYESNMIEMYNQTMDNSNFNLKSKTSSNVIKELMSLMYTGIHDGELVNHLSVVVDEFTNNFNAYIGDRDKIEAVFEIMKSVEYSVNTNIVNLKNKPQNSKYFKKIDGFCKSLERLLELDYELNEDNAWVANNCLYVIGSLSRVMADKSKTHEILTKALTKYEKFGVQYFEAANALNKHFDDKDSNGNIINYKSKLEEGKNKYLPKTYTFDNGKFIVRAGDKVSEEKIKRLYWASSEVKAQFFRMVQNDKALEEGNADDVLNVAIYNSPKEYKMNQKLFGYSTDNGGIYIENVGTFFTYERTPKESIYTLEELFRHEFTHYLQGRYVVPGIFGRDDFHKQDGILNWYEEGTAEFFAGSTRTEGIKPRKSTISNISEERDGRQNLKELFNSKYGIFDFYYYGFALSNYMYTKDLNLFRTVTDYIKKNDVSGYKNYIEKLGNDSNLNEAYMKNIDELLKNQDEIGVPLVSDDYLINHPYKKATEMYDEIKEVANLKDIKTEEKKSKMFNTFDLSGTFVGDRAKGQAEDWNNADKKVNDILKTLSEKEWSGYKTLTAYFTNYRVNDEGNYEYDLVFHGILTDKNIKNEIPTAEVACEGLVNTETDVLFDASKSVDRDGDIESYNWDFGDGTYDEGKIINHKFKNDGIHNVTLSVKDNEGGTATKSVKVNVVKSNKNGITIEYEENNSFYTANTGLGNAIPIQGSVSRKDADWFGFEVEKEGEVEIKLNSNNNDKMIAAVFSEENLQMGELYAQKVGNELIGKKVLRPGKYYVVVYSTRMKDDELINYTVTASGAIKGTNVEPKDEVINEKESNNNFNEAMAVDKNSKIHGEFLDSDNKDYYAITLDEDTDLDITLENANKMGLNWLLYSEENKSTYMAYAKRDGANLVGNQKLKAGKYYLCVYKYDKSNGEYKLNLKSK